MSLVVIKQFRSTANLNYFSIFDYLYINGQCTVTTMHVEGLGSGRAPLAIMGKVSAKTGKV